MLDLTYQQEQNRRQLTESLQKIGQRLTSSLDLHKVLKRILKEVDKLVAYERGAVLLQKGGLLAGVDRLHQVVNNILDVTKIASGSLDVYEEKILLGDIIEQIGRQYEPDLRQRRRVTPAVAFLCGCHWRCRLVC